MARFPAIAVALLVSLQAVAGEVFLWQEAAVRKPVAVAGATATGGTITTNNGTNIVHTFTNSGDFIVSGGSLACDVLIVAGGGGGGYQNATNNGAGGGGGAGGVIYTQNVTVAAGTNPVVVGLGGPRAQLGSNSVFLTFTAVGGGHGTDYMGSGIITNAPSGGSGGGGGGTYPTCCSTGGLGTTGQGYAGGKGSGVDGFPAAGGGGGSAAIGVDGYENSAAGKGGNGGAGLSNNISGVWTNYGGGGGGGVWNLVITNGVGGVGGGGSGGTYTKDAVSGADGLGGGGGGAGYNHPGQSGGSGIVIIRYPAP